MATTACWTPKASEGSEGMGARPKGTGPPHSQAVLSSGSGEHQSLTRLSRAPRLRQPALVAASCKGRLPQPSPQASSGSAGRGSGLSFSEVLAARVTPHCLHTPSSPLFKHHFVAATKCRKIFVIWTWARMNYSFCSWELNLLYLYRVI